MRGRRSILLIDRVVCVERRVVIGAVTVGIGEKD